MAEERKHTVLDGKSDGLSSKSRDISPKSVINPPFTSLPSSASESMDHRVSDKPSPQLELPVERKKYGSENAHPVDPLCKINLKETSDFLKSLPMSKEKNGGSMNPLLGADNLASRANTELKGHKRREGLRHSVPPRLDCPGTPSRFIFGAAENPLPVKYMVGGFTRRPFPSKWDDAEKWLINSSSSFDNSPCNNIVRDLNTGNNPVGSFHELHAKEIRQNQIFSHKAATGDDKLIAGTGDRSKEERYLAGSLAMGDVSSRVSSSVLSTDRRISISSSFGSGSSEHGAFASFPSDVYMKGGLFCSTVGLVYIEWPWPVNKSNKFTDKVETAPKYRSQEPGLEHRHGKHERIPSMKDAGTEVAPAVQHRDMGTEMTPLASSRTSRCHTPVKNASPVRHNTPSSHSGLVNAAGIDIGELEKCHFAKLELQGLPSGIQFTSVDKSVSNWSSREEEEEEVSKSLRHFDMGDCKRSILEARATAWEEIERSKAYTRYQREEARIEAWVNLQSAKAESESRKLEVKIEKMRSNLEEKLMKKMTGAHKRAEEWRAAAKAQHTEQLLRTAERADRMKKEGTFSLYTLPTCNGCFSSCRS
ncbi:hypothetical protein KI387_010056 [Taxus chinensis]|uniref:Remorin C-terminal domain-containing protein n=1 Tax=Taxus chinensis TaxID=29808 RepID=A0AA38FKE2_TAXCH|nr:hypothetical protein KI387_010056 [Taxus chinensis]